MEYGYWNLLDKLWDGLRILPYEDKEVAVGIANCATLNIMSAKIPGNDPAFWVGIITDFFGDILEVEFGAEDGSYSRSYIGKSELLDAVRLDISYFLSLENIATFLKKPENLLLAIRTPDLLFDFRKLAHLFAKQIAPIQVLIRKHAVFYSPARLSVFGLP